MRSDRRGVRRDGESKLKRGKRGRERWGKREKQKE